MSDPGEVGDDSHLQPLAMLATAGAQETAQAGVMATASHHGHHQHHHHHHSVEEAAMMAAHAADASHMVASIENDVVAPPPLEDTKRAAEEGQHGAAALLTMEAKHEAPPLPDQPTAGVVTEDSQPKKKRRRTAPFNAKKNFHIASSRPFNDMLFELIYYKIQHGNVKVPPSNTTLYPWIYELRRKMRLIQQHQSGRFSEGEPQSPCDLTQKRVEVLNHLGMIWDTFKEDAQQKWNKYFEQLTAYKAKNGHCNVPAKEGELGAWVKQQRYCKTVADQKDAGTLRKSCKSGAMSKERQALLESIGFQWKIAPPITGWNNRFEQLRQYKAANGHCNVPQYYKPDKYFGRWVMKQRHEHSLKLRGLKSQLTDEREAKLNAIGFRWVAPGFQKKSVEYHPEDEDDDHPSTQAIATAAVAAMGNTLEQPPTQQEQQQMQVHLPQPQQHLAPQQQQQHLAPQQQPQPQHQLQQPEVIMAPQHHPAPTDFHAL
mmetsp:Transcript_5920/g.16593  ORF Transcript_5920/g.16593 Transcript_5920/m.16593 type:complete len:486 (+) Transcript_5920:90-1547(+)